MMARNSHRREEVEGLFHWTLRVANRRWRRVELIEEVRMAAKLDSGSTTAESAYNRLLERGEIVEMRESKHVYVGLAGAALNWWQSQGI